MAGIPCLDVDAVVPLGHSRIDTLACLFQIFDGFVGPVLEELKHFFVVVALPFFEIGAVLDVHDASFFIEDDKDGVSEAAGVAEAL